MFLGLGREVNLNVNMTISWYIYSSIYSCLVLFIPYIIFVRSIDDEVYTLRCISIVVCSALTAQKKYIQSITMLMIVIVHFHSIIKMEEIFIKSS